MPEVFYPASTPESRRAETERVIANVHADIAPEDQLQALHDLARTADGSPQLDAATLETAAECSCAACCEARSVARREDSDG